MFGIFENIIMDTIILILILIPLWIFVLPGIANIGSNEVGILTRKWVGQRMKQGQIIATNGEIGVQAETLLPGLYWRFPLFWTISKVEVVVVSPGKIGVVKAVDGKELLPGRLLGDEIECNMFQDARAFLENGGYKGGQIAILKPGVYRINKKVFQVDIGDAQNIPEGNIGIVTALDGIPLGSEYVIAPAPVADHGHFQKGQAFINNQGYRGIQLETIQPGSYYINPLLFDVNPVSVSTVPPGFVGVIVSSAGKHLERDIPPQETDAPSKTDTVNPNFNQPVHEYAEKLLITDQNARGIWLSPVAPGTYNLNIAAYKPFLVPTSAITIDWAKKDGVTETRVGQRVDQSDKISEFFNYNQIKATSQDGFQLDVEVRLIIRIKPENAPYIIARFGTINNLIEQIAHPLIDSSFRNEAGNQQAMKFVHSRTEIQEKALQKARQEFEKYHTEVQSLLIAYIHLDETLLKTQTEKEIALQQKEQYAKQAEAQEQRIAVQEKTARANKQSDVIAAELGIVIAENEAKAVVKKAEGEKLAIKLKADGDAYAAEEVGKGQAKAYEAQTDVLGKDKVAIIKILDSIGKEKVKVTPDILVTGNGDQGSGGAIMNIFLAELLKERLEKPKELGISVTNPSQTQE